MNARLITILSAAVVFAGASTAAAQHGFTSAQDPQTAVSSTTAPQPPPTTPRPSRITGTVSGTGTGTARWESDQQPPPAQPALNVPPTAPQGRGSFMQPRGQLINVKVEFTITDQLGTKAAIKKTMTMVVADRESSRIRTNVEYYTPRGNRQVPLSVDVNPVVEGNKIRLDFSIEYSTSEEPPVDEKLAPAPRTTVSERLAAVFDSGVPMVVAQSSDAYSDRKVTIEIKATVMK